MVSYAQTALTFKIRNNLKNLKKVLDKINLKSYNKNRD